MKKLALLFVAFFAFISPAFAQFAGTNAIGAIASSQQPTCTFGGNDSFTKALLHMDGANGGTSFVDDAAGATAAWVSPNGSTTTTSTFKFGTASYQGTTTSWIVSNQSAVYAAGNSDFTVDFWIRGNPATTSTLQYIVGFGDPNQSTSSAWYIYYDTSKNLRANFQNTGFSNYQNIANVPNIFDGNWHYVAYVRASTIAKVYIDGNAIGSAVATSGTMNYQGTYQMMIGVNPTSGGMFGNNKFPGNIDEFHYTFKALYTSNFVPPTLPWCN
jgi:hypothetical protein